MSHPGDYAADAPSAGRLAGRRERVLLVLIAVFAAALFAFRLGAGSLWDVDEPRYVEAGREILTTGDPITQRLNGRAWFGPAPLWMWLQAASGRVLGFSEWSARSWGAAFGVLGVLATYALGREWFGPRTGLLSALVLASTLAYVVTSRLAILDTAAVTWMLASLWAGYRGYRRHRRRDYVLACFFLGLAVLTRGPGAVVLPGLVFGVFLAYRRAFDRPREIPWIPCLLVFFAVAAPWYAVEIGRHGGAFIRAAIWGHAASRFAAPPGVHAGALVYDAAIVVLGAVPWTAFLPGAAVYHYLRRWQDGSLLCLLWGALVLLLAVAVGEQLPADVLPLFPVAAIAVGRLWEEFLFEGAGRLTRTLATSFVLQIGVIALLVVGAAAFATDRYPREFAAVRGSLLAPLAVLVCGTGLTAALFRARRYTAAFLSLPAVMAAFVGVLYAGTLPAVEAQKPMKPLAASLRPRLRPGDRVIAYMMDAPASLVFYSNHLVEQAADPASLRRRLCAPGRAFLVARRDDLAALRTPLPAGVARLDVRGAYVLEMKPAAAACAGGP